MKLCKCKCSVIQKCPHQFHRSIHKYSDRLDLRSQFLHKFSHLILRHTPETSGKFYDKSTVIRLRFIDCKDVFPASESAYFYLSFAMILSCHFRISLFLNPQSTVLHLILRVLLFCPGFASAFRRSARPRSCYHAVSGYPLMYGCRSRKQRSHSPVQACED